MPSALPSPRRSPISRAIASCLLVVLDRPPRLAKAVVGEAQIAERIALAPPVADLAIEVSSARSKRGRASAARPSCQVSIPSSSRRFARSTACRFDFGGPSRSSSASSSSSIGGARCRCLPDSPRSSPGRSVVSSRNSSTRGAWSPVKSKLAARQSQRSGASFCMAELASGDSQSTTGTGAAPGSASRSRFAWCRNATPSRPLE